MFYYYFIGTTAILISLSLAVAWLYQKRWIRWTLIGITIFTIPIAYMGILDLLSRPKPTQLEIINTERAEVLGFKVIQYVAIYILLDVPEYKEPRYYLIPWTTGTAKVVRKLQEGWGKKQKEGGKLMMVKPFGNLSSNRKELFTRPVPPHSEQIKPKPKGIVPEYEN